MKTVAVSQRVDAWPERGECRDALDQRVTAFLLAAGFLPVPVPNHLAAAEQLLTWLATLRPGAIVLSGGNDIGDRPERDQTEYTLLAHAEKQRLPVLGICRGMQMLTVAAGGTLQQLAGHVATRHAIDGTLAGEVNSFHGFGLRACPPDYEPLALAPDGTIEAIRHQTLPWEGWMWHPERDVPFPSRDIDRLKALFA